ncbi:biopolymer transporter ExbD [Chamaesiphon sp. OTE_75_metabat_556]|uniref:ExbD/TolR family protein n=1 Tax=Chamaesiphon sp. OTE_75_metabat_556 TaxID=2964692 RepID=UPI00286B4360|nr:biopolymer transporter ExbD [Chamaesiphon sp. OTE_75_metabat_556]
MRLPPNPDRTPDINVVALIDVLFAILTFFIITSLTLTRNESLPVNLPTAGTGKSQTQTKMIVSIDAQGAIALNRQLVKVETLVPKLQSLIAKEGQTLVIINADERVEHRRVVAVMDRVRQIPGVKLAIATQRK